MVFPVKRVPYLKLALLLALFALNEPCPCGMAPRIWILIDTSFACQVKVKIKASGNANYKASGVKTVSFKVKVK